MVCPQTDDEHGLTKGPRSVFVDNGWTEVSHRAGSTVTTTDGTILKNPTVLGTSPLQCLQGRSYHVVRFENEEPSLTPKTGNGRSSKPRSSWGPSFRKDFKVAVILINLREACRASKKKWDVSSAHSVVVGDVTTGADGGRFRLTGTR